MFSTVRTHFSSRSRNGGPFVADGFVTSAPPRYLLGAREKFFVALRRRTCGAESDFALVRRLLWSHSMVVGARFPIARGLFVSALALGGCAYQPDSFSHAPPPFAGVYVSVECLDLAIARRKNATPESNVLEYRFGNRCEQPALVDLAAARVYGTTVEGDWMDLIAYDPFHELRALRIDARAVGREAIDYPSSEMLEHVCIDAASITHAYPPRWICFNNRD